MTPTVVVIDIPIWLRGSMHVIRITITYPDNGNPTIEISPPKPRPP